MILVMLLMSQFCPWGEERCAQIKGKGLTRRRWFQHLFPGVPEQRTLHISL
jgi:hypothetical protein